MLAGRPSNRRRVHATGRAPLGSFGLDSRFQRAWFTPGCPVRAFPALPRPLRPDPRSHPGRTSGALSLSSVVVVVALLAPGRSWRVRFARLAQPSRILLPLAAGRAIRLVVADNRLRDLLVAHRIAAGLQLLADRVHAILANFRDALDCRTEAG